MPTRDTTDSAPSVGERDEARDFRERLQGLAQRVGSVYALARAAGIPQSTIRKYFVRTDPPRAALLSMARAAGVRAEWLLTGKGSDVESEDGETWIPECGASGGIVEGAGSGPISFRRRWVREHLRCDPDSLRFVHVAGDSMEPTLRAGDMVLVDRSDTEPRDGIFALHLDGVLCVKRLHSLNKKTVEVLSDNRALYPRPRLLAVVGSGAEARIVGRVVWGDRRF